MGFARQKQDDHKSMKNSRAIRFCVMVRERQLHKSQHQHYEHYLNRYRNRANRLR